MGKQKILFYHDEKGLPLESPRKLTPEMCYATGFEVSFTPTDRAPVLYVSRVCGPLADNGWNEDDRPPTRLFSIEFAHVEIHDGMICAVGFELGNLTVAGLPSEPYSQRGLRGAATPVADLIQYRRYALGRNFWGPLSEHGPAYPQKIIILPDNDPRQ